MFRKVLIAVDDSPIAAHAVDVGAELAQALHAEVALIYVIDPSLTYAPESGLSADDVKRAAESEGKRLVADLRSRLPEGLGSMQFISAGPPGPEIARAAEQWPADVIVIGSHGRRGMSRALLGSVAEAVMRHASCPVLIVRTKK